MQLTNQQIIEDLLTSMFQTIEKEPSEPLVELTADEENVIRYACGYVVRKLHQKFLKQHGEKCVSFVECLTQMRANSHEDSVPVTSFMEYTMQWVKIINRGGLYEINNESYLLFKEIETVMQAKLRTHLQQGVDGPPSAKLSGREEILEIVKNEIKVLFYWDILSKIIKDEEFKMNC